MKRKTTIEFSERMSDIIQGLIDKDEARSIAEVVRNSIGLYHLAKKEQRDGNIIAVVDRSGKVIKEIALGA